MYINGLGGKKRKKTQINKYEIVYIKVNYMYQNGKWYINVKIKAKRIK